MFIVAPILPVGKLVEYKVTLPLELEVLGKISAAFTIDMLAFAGITSTMLVLRMFAFE
jgi:hypothetical protein